MLKHTQHLTDRERDVLRELVQGKTNGEIAKALFIVPDTVENHLHNIYRKLGLKNRVHAAMFAVSNGLWEEGKSE